MPTDKTANRIDICFQNLHESGKRAFVAYVCAGDPTLERTLDIILALEEAGADVIELGLPFSDPLADGVVNQMAADRALRSGASTAGVIDLVRRIRVQSQIPLVLFTYLNPVYTYGYAVFHQDASEAGADGILVLDLPPDEAAQNTELQHALGLHHIQLIAPTSSPSRIQTITASAGGFIYYVSRLGVTGAQAEVASGIAEQIAIIRATSKVPVCVGFGVSNPEQAAAIAAMADGVVVGSAIVKLVEQYGSAPDLPERVTAFVKPLVDAVKAV